MNIQDPSVPSSENENTGKPLKFPDTKETGHPSAGDEENSAKQQWKEMREERIKNKKDDIDLSLQSPQDANTQKHVNFLDTEEEETRDSTSATENEESPTQRQWREMREEKMKHKTDDIDPSLQSPQDANTQKHINFLKNDQERTTNESSDED
ncbi:hypothetical protein [Segetibacter koreensis]|uniref:hypothetical protein n=1 Tax=Segetibacter koreensis TaxID=398037 RepID=UPI0003710AC3|nr:hypothetical protein [Segetibacter koreensis]